MLQPGLGQLDGVLVLELLPRQTAEEPQALLCRRWRGAKQTEQDCQPQDGVPHDAAPHVGIVNGEANMEKS
jgi:hypothetical protein